MTKTDREIALGLLNAMVREIKKDLRDAYSAVSSLSHEMLGSLQLLDGMEPTQDEMSRYSFLRELLYERDVKPERDNQQNALFVETAAAMIASEYEKGKYEGREAVGFFYSLFERISPELLADLKGTI